TSHRGPLALIDGTPSKQDIELAARIVARYGSGRMSSEVIIEAREAAGAVSALQIVPFEPSEIKDEWSI
ncbi:MAG: tRNA (5-methylaminomethyl-2-thiouridylate)-methyltransferase, partial [Gammaproteobacteria bacterium]|nr:tRNA (5-methylaminomethyl-2-thiouridylate)-methyltransferase [Gammaproteobacteria bacterium]